MYGSMHFMIKICTVIFGFICLGSLAFGQTTITERVTKSSYPSFILKLMDALPGWKPPLNITSDCQAAINSPRDLSSSACESGTELNLWDSFRSKLFFDYKINETNGFRPIDFTLSNAVSVRGLLALHGKEKRPLVIFRMGIFGNRDEPLAERYILKILFQDLGYHVLALESLTSHGYLVGNEHISAGGFEEGLHTFFILNQIRKKKWDWVTQISDIHLVALSMGGEGAFLTQFLDEETNQQIKSSLFFCPLMNFKTTYDNLLTPSPMHVAMDLWTSRRLKAFEKYAPNLNDLSMWKSFFDFKPRFTPALLSWLNSNRKAPLLTVEDFNREFPDLKIPDSVKTHIDQSQNFDELNNFWGIYKNTKSPITILVTEVDPLVPIELNAGLIDAKKQPGIHLKTTVNHLKGMHCALAEAYQWPFLVELVKRSLNQL